MQSIKLQPHPFVARRASARQAHMLSTTQLRRLAKRQAQQRQEQEDIQSLYGVLGLSLLLYAFSLFYVRAFYGI